MRNIRTLLCGIVLISACGCSAPPKPLVFWPPPPDEPKLLWINTIYSEDDFEKSGFQVFLEKIIGPPEVVNFAKPISAVSDGKGVMYVSDMDYRNIHVYDFNKKTRELLNRKSTFRTVSGLAIDSGGRVYVVDATARAVSVYGPNRELLLSFTHEELKKPVYIAVNEKLGRLYVTDTHAHMVFVFDMAGKLLFTFGKSGNDKDIYGPQGIAIASGGEVAVADTLNARVNVYDADGNFIRTFGQRGDQVGQFEFPSGVAFDSDGHLYVADARKAAVQIFTLEGTFLTMLGGERSKYDFGLNHPAGISIDSNDRLYIADRLKPGVVIWQYLSKRYMSEEKLLEEPRYKQWREEMLKKREHMEKVGAPR